MAIITLKRLNVVKQAATEEAAAKLMAKGYIPLESGGDKSIAPPPRKPAGSKPGKGKGVKGGRGKG